MEDDCLLGFRFRGLPLDKIWQMFNDLSYVWVLVCNSWIRAVASRVKSNCLFLAAPDSVLGSFFSVKKHIMLIIKGQTALLSQLLTKLLFYYNFRSRRGVFSDQQCRKDACLMGNCYKSLLSAGKILYPLIRSTFTEQAKRNYWLSGSISMEGTWPLGFFYSTTVHVAELRGKFNMTGYEAEKV